MSKLWTKNNKLIVSGGKLIICDHCPCEPPAPCSCPCGDSWGTFPCNGLKATYRLKFDWRVQEFLTGDCSGDAQCDTTVNIDTTVTYDALTSCTWCISSQYVSACGYSPGNTCVQLNTTTCGWQVGTDFPFFALAYKSTGLTPVGKYGPDRDSCYVLAPDYSLHFYFSNVEVLEI
jgi:hypothetical protein